jgi:hypothetical protein
VRGIAVRSTGEVIAAVGGVVASYNGTTWTELPDLSAPHFRSAVTLPDDDVLVLGDGWMMPWGGTAIARWNGTAFSAMGGPNWGQAMHALVRRNGELLVAGNNLDVQPAGYSSIVRWTGSSFVALDPALTGTVYSLAELPNGDVIAAGALLRNGLPIGNLMRWNGASWSPIAGDVGGHANDVAVDGQGRIFVAGSFATAGGITAPGFARTDLPCPAAVAAFGSGCVSAAGPVALAAENLPWAGATHRSLATGMASPSLAVHIVGLSALTQPLPFGAPGCLSFVDPLHTQFLVPNGGLCVIATVLPNTPGLRRHPTADAGGATRTRRCGAESRSHFGQQRVGADDRRDVSRFAGDGNQRDHQRPSTRPNRHARSIARRGDLLTTSRPHEQLVEFVEACHEALPDRLVQFEDLARRAITAGNLPRLVGHAKQVHGLIPTVHCERNRVARFPTERLDLVIQLQ